MKTYVYRVAYTYQGGNGACTVTRNRPIQYGDDFEQLQKCIGEENGFEKVAVYNIIRLKGLYRPVKVK